MIQASMNDTNNDERVADSARFTSMIDEHRKRCQERNCVNWKCDGARHFNIAGDHWGDGWEELIFDD